MNTVRSNTFCVRPFSSLYIATDGSFRFCCGDSYPEISQKYNITNTDLSELWNSSYYKKIRAELLYNIIPRSCKSRCFHIKYKNEFIVAPPRRLIDEHNQRKLSLGPVKYDSYSDFNPTMGLDTITFIELWFSNKCNLKCRMCNPTYSNQLYDEWNDIPHVTKINSMETYDWTESTDAWNNLFNFLNLIISNNPNQVVNFILSGGEPMIAEGMYKFFDLLLEKNLAKNITISYNTNLTVLPTKLINYWSSFNKIKLNISCDGYERVNDYIRYPSKWDKLMSNLDILKNIEGVNLDWSFVTTLQIYNITNILTLDNWVQKQGKNLHINDLVYPTYLSIRALPLELKLLVGDKWKKQNGDKLDSKWLKTIIYMFSEDQSSEFSKFIDFTKHLDNKRNQNVLDIFPELEKYW